MTIDELGGWPGLMARLSGGESLAPDEAAAAMRDILEGKTTPAQIAAFAIGLRNKGETVEEMSGLVRAMLDHAEPVPAGDDLVDTLTAVWLRQPSTGSPRRRSSRRWSWWA